MASSKAATRQRKRKMSWGKNINSELSNEIIQLIFSKLNNFLNLCNCRAVCKAWNKLVLDCKSFDSKSSINSNLFIAQIAPSSSVFHCVDFNPKHLDKTKVVASFSINPCCKKIKILNSCNGLLLCYLFLPSIPPMDRNVVCVLNPVTNEYIRVFFQKEDIDNYHYAFGFAFKSKRYKIVRYSIVGRLNTKWPPIVSLQLRKVEIHASTANSHGQWTVATSRPFLLQGHGTYFNGALYWVGKVYKRAPFPPVMYVIIRLDLDDENFEQISFPWFENPDGEWPRPFKCFLWLLNDGLYLTIQMSASGQYQVWKMEEDFSWIKAFVVRSNQLNSYNDKKLPSLQPSEINEDGEILCSYKTSKQFSMSQNDKQGCRLKLNQIINCFKFDPLHKILGGDL